MARKTINVTLERERIDTFSGIVYAQIKTLRAIRPLRMTLMTPRTPQAKAAILYFPGGGFTTSDHEKFIEMRYALAQAGFVVAAVEYRTVPDKYPALIEDGKAAIRYLRAHSKEYGIDPQRIGVLGDSAGGYLAQMLGLTNQRDEFDKGDFLEYASDVQAVTTIYGLSDLLTIDEGISSPDSSRVHASPAVTEALLVHGVAFRDFPGASIHSDEAKALAASPVGNITSSAPPFLIMHGMQDRLVSPAQSEHLYQGLIAQGNHADLIMVENAEHGDLVWAQKAVVDEVVAWFSKTLA